MDEEELTRRLRESAESLEEVAVLLAEVHVRFGQPKIMDSEYTFGDAARLYEWQAQAIRNYLLGKRTQ